MHISSIYTSLLLLSVIPFTLANGGYGIRRHTPNLQTCKAKTIYRTETEIEIKVKTVVRNKTVTKNNIVTQNKVVTKTIEGKGAGTATVTTTMKVTQAPAGQVGEEAPSNCPPVVVHTSKVCPDREPCPEEKRCVRKRDIPVLEFGCECLGKRPRTVTVDQGCPNECCDLGVYDVYNFVDRNCRYVVSYNEKSVAPAS
ncbi:hypothetical protein TWF718_003094 [Orbilia javanica]|uniref:Uncharacterized protein n=1 Tax=Orbilia javanica TaxID=47235 RepID=A0AAN8MH15_9PEZI